MGELKKRSQRVAEFLGFRGKGKEGKGKKQGERIPRGKLGMGGEKFRREKLGMGGESPPGKTGNVPDSRQNPLTCAPPRTWSCGKRNSLDSAFPDLKIPAPKFPFPLSQLPSGIWEVPGILPGCLSNDPNGNFHPEIPVPSPQAPRQNSQIPNPKIPNPRSHQEFPNPTRNSQIPPRIPKSHHEFPSFFTGHPPGAPARSQSQIPPGIPKFPGILTGCPPGAPAAARPPHAPAPGIPGDPVGNSRPPAPAARSPRRGCPGPACAWSWERQKKKMGLGTPGIPKIPKIWDFPPDSVGKGKKKPGLGEPKTPEIPKFWDFLLGSVGKTKKSQGWGTQRIPKFGDFPKVLSPQKIRMGSSQNSQNSGFSQLFLHL